MNASVSQKTPQCAVILVAAGKGTRLGGDVPKQFLPLGGRPLFTHSLDLFMSLPFVTEVALVLPADTPADAWGGLIASYGERLVRAVGGARRQDSVAAGLEALRRPCDVALVHDAARPFVQGENVERLAWAAMRTGGGLLAMRSADTVKQARQEPDGPCVAGTLDRETIWLAQTPQAIRADLVPRAIAAFRDPANTVTDEASLLEQWGVPVRLVESSSLNFKVTHPEDFAKAEAILAGRERAANGAVRD